MMAARASGPGGVEGGIKRKRGAENKFYAVRIGANPGIYHSYDEVLRQVRGVKGAMFKSFPTLSEAQNFVDHGLSGTKSQKFYAVRNGRMPGIYTDWPAAEAQITGFTKPKYKSFPTRAQAEAFMNGGDGVADADGASRSKKTKPNESALPAGAIDERWQPGTGPLPEGSVDGFDSRIMLNAETGRVEYKTKEQLGASKMVPVSVAPGQPLRIYTDGSSLKNGAVGAQAGVGVYFGPGDARNISEALAGSRQTNQRAELTAIKRAIDVAERNRDVVIVTDSKYSISCCTEWFQGWRRNGWQTADKKAVENRDLIEAIVHSIDERFRLRARTNFEWVKGHANDEGNTAADWLAVQGAHRAASGDGLR